MTGSIGIPGRLSCRSAGREWRDSYRHVPGLGLGPRYGGGIHLEESAEALKRLKRRELTGLEYLLEYCDGKFWDEDLDERGNAFAADYYDGQSAFATQYGSYLSDYCEVFNRLAAEQGREYPSIYYVENSWENYDRLKPMLDDRFAQWEVWSEGPSNRKLDPKAQFLQACQQTGQQFIQAEGFKSNKAGTVWKKQRLTKIPYSSSLSNRSLTTPAPMYG